MNINKSGFPNKGLATVACFGLAILFFGIWAISAGIRVYSILTSPSAPMRIESISGCNETVRDPWFDIISQDSQTVHFRDPRSTATGSVTVKGCGHFRAGQETTIYGSGPWLTLRPVSLGGWIALLWHTFLALTFLCALLTAYFLIFRGPLRRFKGEGSEEET